jgi:hypothetical protein
MMSTVGKPDADAGSDPVTDSPGVSAGVQDIKAAEISRETRIQAGECDQLLFFIFCPSIVVQAFYPYGVPDNPS